MNIMVFLSSRRSSIVSSINEYKERTTITPTTTKKEIIHVVHSRIS
jgi:hypothetical protein